MAALERAVGDRLLNRDVHPPTLTATGEAFLPHARAAVSEWEAALSAASWRTGVVRGVVSIGSIPSVTSQLLAPAMAEFATRYPDVAFEVHEGPNSWLDEALSRRTVQLTIRPAINERHTILTDQEPLLTDPFVVLMRHDDPLATHPSLTLDDLAGHRLITTGEAGFDPRVGVEFRALLEDSLIQREHSIAVTQPTSVFAFVYHGLGLGLIGHLAARMNTYDALIAKPLDHPAAQRMIAVYRARARPLPPATFHFLENVRQRATRLNVEPRADASGLSDKRCVGSGGFHQ